MGCIRWRKKPIGGMVTLVIFVMIGIMSLEFFLSGQIERYDQPGHGFFVEHRRQDTMNQLMEKMRKENLLSGLSKSKMQVLCQNAHHVVTNETFPSRILKSASRNNDRETKIGRDNDTRVEAIVRRSIRSGYSSTPKCDVIQIVVACAGHKASREVLTLIKSMLFYRKNPVHVHFLSDDAAQIVLSTLFKTWRVPGVKISFYKASSFTDDLYWFTNRHVSDQVDVLKLMLPKILPADIEKVIVLNRRVVINTDVGDLWGSFADMEEREAIGLVENQNDWYLGTVANNNKPWPALGRGFNSGVMLLHLTKLRAMGWMQMWRYIAGHELANRSEKDTVSDQDIFNAVLRQHSDIIHILPCVWNVQLKNVTQSKLCFSEITDVKATFWNNDLRFVSKTRQLHYFNIQRLTFRDFESAHLTKDIYGCKLENQHLPLEYNNVDENDTCYEIRRETNLIYRTHPYYTEFDYKPRGPGNDVTFVAQLSLDRIQILATLYKNWYGPISLALYVASDAEAFQFLEFLDSSPDLMARTNVAYHVVYKIGQFYPVNYLRNVALEYIITPFVYISDIDFLPMPGMYPILKKAVIQRGDSPPKRAFVVPAFETLQYRRMKFPRKKGQLLELLREGKVFTFHKEVWAKGHAPTNYTKWENATAPYKIPWEPVFEPYIVIDKNCPKYDRRFIGYGGNKVSQIMEVHAHGYEFYVLPSVFSIHMPHRPSIDATKFFTSSHYKECIKVLKSEFKDYLFNQYGLNLTIQVDRL